MFPTAHKPTACILAIGGLRRSLGRAATRCGLSGQVSDEVDFGAQGKALEQVISGLLDGGTVERMLTDVLDGFVRRSS